MKSALPIALVCFALGFLTSWLIKDRGAASQEAAKSNNPASTGSTNKVERIQENEYKNTTLSRSARKPETEQKQEEAKNMAKSMSFDAKSFLKNSIDKKDKALLEKLTRELNLSPAQIEKLRSALTARSEKIGELDMNNENDEPLLQGLLDSKKLDDQIIAQLTDEQKTAFSEMKEKDRQSKIDSNTLKNLGKITEAITLSEEQRTAIYNTLSDKEAKVFDSEQDQQSLQKTLFEGLGMGDDDDLSLHGIISDPVVQEQMESAGSGQDAQNIMATAMREAITKKVYDKVSLIAPHLTPEQSNQYRQHLQQKADATLDALKGSAIQIEK